MPPYPTARRSRRPDVLRAVVTLAWTSALVVGVPSVLAAFFGWPLPRQMPDWGEVLSTPIQLIDPTVILNFFVCLAWLCWAALLGYVVLDVVDVTRGLGQRVHRLGPLSGVAAKLVASVVLLVSLTRQPATSSFAAKPPAPVAQVVDLPAAPIAAPGPPAEIMPAAADAPAVATIPFPTYRVCRNDSLWAIAETHLGSGFRWKEIFDLNRDQIHDPDYIEIDQALTLPTDAVGLPSTSAPVQAPEAASPAPPVDPASPVDPAPEALPTPTTPTDSTAAPISPSTTVATRAQPTVVPPSAPTSALANPPASTDAPVTTPAPTGRVPVVPGIAGATALASGLLLALLRSRRRRTALAGRRAHRSADPSGLERAILAAADVPLVRWAGQELAALALAIDDRTFDAGPVAVEFSADVGLEILWDRPVTTEAPRPWEAVPGGWAWRCLYDPDAPVPEPDQPSPIAGLTTFGQRDGRQLLVDLESLGTLAVVGDPVRAENFVRSLVLELGANDDLSDAYVFTVEGALDIDGTERFDRVHHASLQQVHGRIAAAANSTGHALDGHALSGFAYQARDTELAGLEVYVAIARSSPAIQDLIDAAPARSGAVVVILGEADTAATLTIDERGTGHLEPLGLTFDAAGVARDLAAQVAVLLDDTEPQASPTGVLDPTAEAVSAPPPGTGPDSTPPVGDPRAEVVEQETEPAPGPAVIDLTEPMTTDADDEWSLPAVRLLVKVLGVPSMRDRPQLGRRELMVVVFVASRSRPVTQDDVQEAIWGGAAVSEKTVSNLVGHTRSALGDWDSQPILGRVTGGTMQLADGVFTDHQLFELLSDRAKRLSSSQAAPLLHQALDLIDGPPFDADGYEWAHVSQLVADIENRIERVALDLVVLELEAGDVEEARRAVMQGLRALPGNEVLYRERIRIEEAAGNIKAARSALMELIYYLEDLGAEPSTGTIAQYGHLIGDRQRR